MSQETSLQALSPKVISLPKYHCLWTVVVSWEFANFAPHFFPFSFLKLIYFLLFFFLVLDGILWYYCCEAGESSYFCIG